MTVPLPYGHAVTAVLTPLRTAFRVLNRWMAAPLIRAGADRFSPPRSRARSCCCEPPDARAVWSARHRWATR